MIDHAPSVYRGPSSERASTTGRVPALRGVAWLASQWWWPGVLLLALASWRLTRPALWPDEFATWGVARLSWGQLFALTRVNDGAITPYYVFMKLWTAVLGSSEQHSKGLRANSAWDTCL